MSDPETEGLGLPAPGHASSGVDTQMQRAALKHLLFGTPNEPQKIGRYKILSKLGEGGMGVVYRAHDSGLDRPVAIKLLRHPDADTERLLQEGRAMAQLSHPNVVQVYDVGAYEDQVFVAMELVPGQTLRAWFGSQGEGPERGRRWRSIVEHMIQAGEGLHAAHETGLVHRDFKPDNVLVGEDQRVRVLDFGLASRAEGEVTAPDPGREPTTDVDPPAPARAGTVAYMAPEQLESGTFDARSDQYSFCVTLFEGLYGQRPFRGRNLPEYALQSASGTITTPAGVRIPKWLDRMVRRGLDPRPERRWPSMRALLDA